MTFTAETTEEGKKRIADYPIVVRLAEIAPSWFDALHFPHDIGIEVGGEPPSRIGFRTDIDGKITRVSADFPPAEANDDELRIFMMEQLGRLAEKVQLEQAIAEMKNLAPVDLLAALLKTGRNR
jgi:hypothetical protein